MRLPAFYGVAGIIAALAATPVFAVQESPIPGLIEDTAPGWNWSGMTSYSDSLLSGGSGHSGGPGTFGVYTFTGTGVDVIAMRSPVVQDGARAHRTGKLKVTIDGQEKDVVNLNASENEYNVKAYSITGLSNGTHVLQLDPVGGWVVVDCIRVASPDAAGAAAPAAGGAPFSDDFLDGAASRWKVYGGDWIVVAGQYEINGGSGNKSLVAGSDYHDVTVEADIRVASGNDAGVVFRVQSPGIGTDAYDGYYAGLDYQNKAIVIGKASNSWTALVHQPYPLEMNRTYRFKVAARGQTITVSVDGETVATAQDDSYTSGAVGVRTFNASAAFSRFRATPLGK